MSIINFDIDKWVSERAGRNSRVVTGEFIEELNVRRGTCWKCGTKLDKFRDGIRHGLYLRIICKPCLAIRARGSKRFNSVNACMQKRERGALRERFLALLHHDTVNHRQWYDNGTRYGYTHVWIEYCYSYHEATYLCEIQNQFLNAQFYCRQALEDARQLRLEEKKQVRQPEREKALDARKEWLASKAFRLKWFDIVPEFRELVFGDFITADRIIPKMTKTKLVQNLKVFDRFMNTPLCGNRAFRVAYLRHLLVSPCDETRGLTSFHRYQRSVRCIFSIPELHERLTQFLGVPSSSTCPILEIPTTRTSKKKRKRRP
jgi:hypothetical protein